MESIQRGNKINFRIVFINTFNSETVTHDFSTLKLETNVDVLDLFVHSNAELILFE